MVQTILNNAAKPAPKWYRKTKKIISLLGGGAFLTFVQIFKPTDVQVANIGLVIAFLPTVLEVLNTLLVGDETTEQ